MRRNHDVVTFRLPPDYRERLEAEAKACGVSLSAHVRTILIAHAENSQLKIVYRGLMTVTETLQSLQREVREHRQEFRDAVS